jgi:aspartate kinase
MNDKSIVVKFGGSTFPQNDLYRGFSEARKYLSTLYEGGRRPVAVVSAPQGMSDLVLEAERAFETGYTPKNPIVARAAEHVGNRKKFAASLAEGIMDVYSSETKKMGPSGNKLLEKLEREVDKLKWSFEAIDRSNNYERRAMPENHSGTALSYMLEDAGIESRYFDGMQVGVKASPRGMVMRSVSSHDIRETLDPHLGRGSVPVVGGYIGRRIDNGEPIILGRNTTDVTGSIVALSIGAKDYHIIKDVKGIYRIEPVIRVNGESIMIPTDFLDKMSYDEAIQIAWRGSKVVHPCAIDIARDGPVKVRVKSIGEDEGTLISQEPGSTAEKPVAAISTGRFHLLSINDPAMSVPDESHGYMHKVTGILAKNGVSFSDCATPASAMTFAIPLDYDGKVTDIEFLKSDLGKCLREYGYNPRDVSSRNVGGISLTGDAMRGAPGVTARISGVLGRENVNIIMGGQTDEKGSSAINYYVELEHFGKAIRALCSDLF